MLIDWQAAALAAKRANAAYVEKAADSKAAFSSFGDTWIDLYSTDSHQAVVSVDGSGSPWLSISGTRASAGKVLDVFADVSLEPQAVAGGNVTVGVIRGMDLVWNWALSVIPSDVRVSVCGHSLGASRTHLTPLFLPLDLIGSLWSFEAPKFCDAQFYATYAGALADMTCFLDGRDTWAAWPWADPRWQARPQQDHVWLESIGFQIIPASQWPGGGSFGDHSMNLVQSRIEAIAASAVTSAA